MAGFSASPKTLARLLKRGRYRRDDDGVLEKKCSGCRDYWPADTEFFFSSGGCDGLSTYCKACYIERRYPNGRTKAVLEATSG